MTVRILASAPIEELGLSARIERILRADGITDIAELAKKSLRELARTPNLGHASTYDIAEALNRRRDHLLDRLLAEWKPTEDPDGYTAPFVEFLSRDLDTIEDILQQLVLDHGEHKPIDSWIAKIEDWMGDDWHVDLSEEDQKRLDAIKGWTYG